MTENYTKGIKNCDMYKMDFSKMRAIEDTGANEIPSLFELDIDLLLSTMKYESEQTSSLESFKFTDDNYDKPKSLVPDLPPMSDLDLLDIDLDDTIGSCDTTLSATEGTETGLDIDIQEILLQAERKYEEKMKAGEVQSLELEIIEVPPSEIEIIEIPSSPDYDDDDNDKDTVTCLACDVSISNKNNLKRHLNSARHKRIILEEEEAIAEEIDNLVQTKQLTLGQMTGLEEILADEERHFESIEPLIEERRRTFPDPRGIRYGLNKDKGKRILKCRYCPKVFTLNTNLKRHEKLHADKKLHVCSCGKSFMQKEYLKKHQIVHEREWL